MKAKLLCGILSTLLLAQISFAQNSKDSNSSEEMQLITLQLRTNKDLLREITVAFSDFTTADFDEGYDQRMMTLRNEDIYTYLDKDKMIAQAFPAITNKTVVPLAINTTGDYKYGITAVDFDGFDKDTGVFLYDRDENMYIDLRTGAEYGFNSGEGEFNRRFELVFKTNKAANRNNNVNMFYNNRIDNLFVKGLESAVSNVAIYDINGYLVNQWSNVQKRTLESGINLSDLRTGIYIVSVAETNGQVNTKKIIIQ